jgi:hypothetical protein
LPPVTLIKIHEKSMFAGSANTVIGYRQSAEKMFKKIIPRQLPKKYPAARRPTCRPGAPTRRPATVIVGDDVRSLKKQHRKPRLKIKKQRPAGTSVPGHWEEFEQSAASAKPRERPAQ